MMTPGDFASLQEGREGLSTEDYIAWKLPYVHSALSPRVKTDRISSEEEDPEEYPFPLTLRNKRAGNATDEYQANSVQLDGASSPPSVAINGGVSSAATAEAAVMAAVS